MNKIKIGVIFGGMSTENEVSCISGASVIKHLNKEKYNVFPIYIDKIGNWYKVKLEDVEKSEELENKEHIENITEYLKQMDVIFPVLHGLYGEDGTIQGLFELLKIPYVGCGVLASSVGMDKVYTKLIFEKANINQAKYIYIRKYNEKYIYIDEEFNEKILELEDIAKITNNKLRFPVFVKPSNSGSSVGINKAHNIEELKNAIVEAGKYDNKILIEEGIVGKEVECAVLGNEDVISSCVGEIKSAEDFYSFDSKYKNSKSYTEIPANIGEHLAEEIRNLAVKAFQAVDGKGLARVDFFIENSTNEIYINEINTMPGFTQISMYPKLWEAVGVSYSKLLDELIALAVE